MVYNENTPHFYNKSGKETFMSNILFSVFPNENFIDMSLYQFGWEQCQPSHSYGPAARNHYLFHYVISGTGTLMADDTSGITQTYSVKSGQGFMIFPQQITTYIADQKLPWEYVWIEFDGLRVKEILELAGLTKSAPIYHAHSKEMREVLKEEMLYIARNPEQPPFHLIGHLYLFMDALTRSCTREQTNSAGRLRDFYIHEAIAFIEQNFQNDISVEDIAEVCGLNRSYFGKIFKETLGRSPQEFLMNYRMVKATELLKLTQLSISEISNAVGYANPLHFSRAFKNVYGESPRIWASESQDITSKTREIILPGFLIYCTVAISISVSFLISVFSRLVISASAVSIAVSTLTPVSIAFLRMTNPSLECSAPSCRNIDDQIDLVS